MRLFTPSTHDGLPGMPFPGEYRFPSGAEMAGYLASYADRFALPVRTGAHVDGLFRDGEHYLLTSGTDAYSADNVVLATGPHRTPRVPNTRQSYHPQSGSCTRRSTAIPASSARDQYSSSGPGTAE